MTPLSLERRAYEAADLLLAHPPRWRHPHKRLVHELCTAAGPPAGRIGYTRWAALPLPESRLLHPGAVQIVPDVFDYAPAAGTVWHVNFADPNLFIAYGSPLLAQDELQALEHPALGALREALLAERLPAVTEEAGRPTPVLVTGVERRCALDTAPDPEAGRPRGLYGNRFATATTEQVRGALRVLTPPPRSHLIAMAAPAGGRGRYTGEQIALILQTSLTAFRAAVLESASLSGDPVEVRTGFWGCGAFGGDRVLMTLLQVLAARLAGVDKLVLYAFNQAGVMDAGAGVAAATTVLRGGPEGEPLSALLGRIEARGHVWGQSDGN